MSNSTTPTKSFTFTAGGIIRSAEVNSDLDALFAELQGNVGTANLLDSSITTTKITDANVTLAKLEAAIQTLLVPTGAMFAYTGTTAPTGYVLASGKTIGNLTSGGTERANSDTANLFTLIWNSFLDAQCPVSGGRGANGPADFSANKTITLPDLRGRIIAGLDNLGGSAASRLTNVATGANFDATINGNSGGAQGHALTTAELAAHNHTTNETPHSHTTTITSGSGAGTAGSGFGPGGSTGTTSTGITINNTGSGTAHTSTQPTYVTTIMIKL